jgi:hypothetical protein
MHAMLIQVYVIYSLYVERKKNQIVLNAYYLTTDAAHIKLILINNNITWLLAIVGYVVVD